MTNLRVDENKAYIVENENAIAENHDTITQNQNAITVNHDAIVVNQNAIAVNHDAIAQNQNAIAVNHDAITENENTIVGYSTDIIIIEFYFSTKNSRLETSVAKLLIKGAQCGYRYVGDRSVKEIL